MNMAISINVHSHKQQPGQRMIAYVIGFFPFYPNLAALLDPW